jgi:hypothetical protein
MNNADNDELTPQEAAAFATLPRFSVHDELAEQRTVDALRARGLLGVIHQHRRSRGLMISAGVAASLVLFAGGTLFGRTLAKRDAAPTSPSAQVQRAGTAYVAALVNLSRARDSERLGGVQAGAATLRAAAWSLAQINPADSIATQIRSTLSSAAVGTDANVIWF